MAAPTFISVRTVIQMALLCYLLKRGVELSVFMWARHWTLVAKNDTGGSACRHDHRGPEITTSQPCVAGYTNTPNFTLLAPLLRNGRQYLQILSQRSLLKRKQLSVPTCEDRSIKGRRLQTLAQRPLQKGRQLRVLARI